MQHVAHSATHAAATAAPPKRRTSTVQWAEASDCHSEADGGSGDVAAPLPATADDDEAGGGCCCTVAVAGSGGSAVGERRSWGGEGACDGGGGEGTGACGLGMDGGVGGGGEGGDGGGTKHEAHPAQFGLYLHLVSQGLGICAHEAPHTSGAGEDGTGGGRRGAGGGRGGRGGSSGGGGVGGPAGGRHSAHCCKDTTEVAGEEASIARMSFPRS